MVQPNIILLYIFCQFEYAILLLQIHEIYEFGHNRYLYWPLNKKIYNCIAYNGEYKIALCPNSCSGSRGFSGQQTKSEGELRTVWIHSCGELTLELKEVGCEMISTHIGTLRIAVGTILPNKLLSLLIFRIYSNMRVWCFFVLPTTEHGLLTYCISICYGKEIKSVESWDVLST